MKPGRFEIDEQVMNAFVDGELSMAERSQVLSGLHGDPAAAERLCQLRNLKDQLRLAYADVDTPAPRRLGRSRGRMALAAGLLFVAVGSLVGWLTRPALETDRVVLLDGTGRGSAPAQKGSSETRIVVHVSEPDQARAAEVLAEVEDLLRSYERENRAVRVEVVVNGRGLDLLRAGFSDYQARIDRLAQQYSNLTFVACKNTIERVEVEEGTEVELLPHVQVTPSGVTHIVNRQRAGWSYIQA